MRALVVAAWIASAGCAHGGAEVRDGVYEARHTAYRLGTLGPGWQRHDSDADAAFYDPQLDAMIMVNSECPAEHDAPLEVAANTLLIGFTDKRVVAESRDTVAGREALRRRVRAKLDGAPLALDLVVVKKDGCLYDLVYLAPPDTAARGAPDFERLVGGFDTVEGARVAKRSSGGP